MDEIRKENEDSSTSDEVNELGPSVLLSRENDKTVHSNDLEAVVVVAHILEVALHTILYIRQVYPIELFERRVKYGIPVFQCIDQSIHEYISEAIKALSGEIAEGNVARVIISIHQSETSLEKFIFSFEYTDNSDDGKLADVDILPLDFIQRQARGMFLKLNAVDAQLLPLETSDDLSFSVVMQLREGGALRISEDDVNFDVARDEGKKEKSKHFSEPFRIKDPALVHIIRTGRFSVYLHVQESEAKSLGTASKVPKNCDVAKPADEHKEADPVKD